MGGDDDGGLGVVVADDGIQDVVPGGRVHAADGLIQQVKPRPAAHDQDQLHLLPGALGHLLDPLLRADVQPQQHLHGPVPVKVPVKVLEKVQQLPGLHPLGQTGPVRQIGHVAVGLLPRLLSGYQDLPAGGGQQAVGQLDEGGLAAAVGAQKPNHPARLDAEVHAVQGLGPSKALTQLSAFKYRHVLLPTGSGEEKYDATNVSGAV